ncbi:MAG: hypothetical protein H6Q41_3445 [Deltaproteobacteria bacterium]|nr:hypothetical protein [Deltaproteobacteria bacterium]
MWRVERGFDYFLLSTSNFLLSTFHSQRFTLEPLNPLTLDYFFYEFPDLLIKSLGRFHHHHMAGIGEDFQF